MEEADELDIESLVRDVAQFDEITSQVRKLQERQRTIKERLMALLELHGEEDDKGHLRIELPESIGNIKSLQRQRRASASLDPDAAEEILKTAGQYKECIEMLPILSDEKIFEALFEGRLTEDQVDKMYPVTVSYAFVPVRR